MKQNVTFVSAGLQLAGHLYTPEEVTSDPSRCHSKMAGIHRYRLSSTSSAKTAGRYRMETSSSCRAATFVLCTANRTL
jgi:hypothetical protein